MKFLALAAAASALTLRQDPAEHHASIKILDYFLHQGNAENVMADLGNAITEASFKEKLGADATPEELESASYLFKSISQGNDTVTLPALKKFEFFLNLVLRDGCEMVAEKHEHHAHTHEEHDHHHHEEK